MMQSIAPALHALTLASRLSSAQSKEKAMMEVKAKPLRTLQREQAILEREKELGTRAAEQAKAAKALQREKEALLREAEALRREQRASQRHAGAVQRATAGAVSAPRVAPPPPQKPSSAIPVACNMGAAYGSSSPFAI